VFYYGAYTVFTLCLHSVYTVFTLCLGSSARDYGLDLSLYSDDDPSLMSGGDEGLDIPENNVGRVWMSLEYNPETERLHVMLMKIKNLPSRTCSSNNACDPVVR